MAYYFTIIDSQNGLGYSSAAVEDFYNDIVNQVQLIEQGDMTMEMLRDNFNSLTLSNAVIFFFRLVCSCYIQQHPEHFAAFVGIDSQEPVVVAQDLRNYCLREVEPLEREVEQVQIIALASALQIGVRVVHLDRTGGPLNHHDFPCEVTPQVHMLPRCTCYTAPVASAAHPLWGAQLQLAPSLTPLTLDTGPYLQHLTASGHLVLQKRLGGVA